MGIMARRQPRELHRHLAAHNKEGCRARLRLVCRGAGRQPVLWLDRWPEAGGRYPELAAEVHTPQAGQPMVAAQPRPCSRIDGCGANAASGPARSGRREAIGKVGQGLRVTGDGEGASRSWSCAGDRSGSEGLL